MGSFINQAYYKEIKVAVDGYRRLDARAVQKLDKRFGASETTLRRIKRSRDFADYLRIAREDAERRRGKRAEQTTIDEAVRHDSRVGRDDERRPQGRNDYGWRLKIESLERDNKSLRQKLELCEKALCEVVLDNIDEDMEHYHELNRQRRTYNLRGLLWFVLGVLVGTALVAYLATKGVL
jgi:hypothetical protein